MSAQIRRSVFEPFSWLSDDLRNDPAAEFAAKMKDLSSGVHTCLQMVEISELDRQYCLDQDPPTDGAPPEVPLLSVRDSAVLMRLAISVTKIMSEQAEEFHQAAQKLHDRTHQGTSDAGGNHE